MTNLFLDRASRNARTLRWLALQPTETKDNIRALEAGHLGCPYEETLCPELEALDDDTLAFVYTYFARQIDRS